ncbi:hypothetical protein Leryth_000294 [Lithospermum erythrorhizon]|nr:hypothetical protein Leryth_000294 [Lithospermum erythrorhizon]
MSSSLRLMLLQPPPSVITVSHINCSRKNIGFSAFGYSNNHFSRKKAFGVCKELSSIGFVDMREERDRNINFSQWDKYWLLWDSKYGIHASRTDSDTQLCVGYNSKKLWFNKQPPESQELLSKVKNVIEKPYNDHLPLIEASSMCLIISQVQQVICFAFHDSRLLMETCQEAKNLRKIVTLFYLD